MRIETEKRYSREIMGKCCGRREESRDSGHVGDEFTFSSGLSSVACSGFFASLTTGFSWMPINDAAFVCVGGEMPRFGFLPSAD